LQIEYDEIMATRHFVCLTLR